jgi:hypothetical protein
MDFQGQEGRVKVGEIVELEGGELTRVVDRFQKAQTRGWWVDEVRVPRTVAGMWSVEPDDSFYNTLCLCPINEMDVEEEATKPVADLINHPPHYTRSGIETIDVIEAWHLGYHIGNVVKYISRAGHKDPTRELEDLRKARWYLDREIARLESTPEGF